MSYVEDIYKSGFTIDHMLFDSTSDDTQMTAHWYTSMLNYWQHVNVSSLTDGNIPFQQKLKWSISILFMTGKK